MSDLNLKPGQVVTNRQLMDLFQCACEGGIRYSSGTDTIVLVNNLVKNLYPVEWKDGKLLFVGQKEKSSGMTRLNKRLIQFLNEKKDVYLFESREAGKYEYKGKIYGSGEPRLEMMPDSGGLRWVFPLELSA